jgi:hypothetical protein
MKLIDATGKEWRKQCVQCAHAGEDFMATGFLASDLTFLRNLGYCYHYTVLETTASFYFRKLFKI